MWIPVERTRNVIKLLSPEENVSHLYDFPSRLPPMLTSLDGHDGWCSLKWMVTTLWWIPYFGHISQNGSWVHYRNLIKFPVAVIFILIIQSGYNYAHATTAQLSWHVQNCDLIWSIFAKSEQHRFLRDLDCVLMNALWNEYLIMSDDSLIRAWLWRVIFTTCTLDKLRCSTEWRVKII